MPSFLWRYVSDSAKARPDHPAVEAQDGTLTYAELEDAGARFAAALAARGIGRDARTAMFMPKSFRSVVTMIGSTRAGAAYVPLDPNSPGGRAALVLDDCDVSCIVASSANWSKLLEEAEMLPASLKTVVLTSGSVEDAGTREGVELIAWDDFVAVDPMTDVIEACELDPAYFLYTSGSTGKPKGVILSHRNVITFVDFAVEKVGVSPDDRLSNHAPLHFDASVFDIYAALKAGATVVFVPDRVAPFPPKLVSWIIEQRINIWYSVPTAVIRMLLHGGLKEASFPDLRVMMYVGEVFQVKYLREVMAAIPDARFYNFFGPAETTITTVYALPKVLPDDVKDVSIGKAIGNSEVFAVKDDGTLAEVGEEGELWVRGPNVMLGYWNLPERTAACFVQDPRHNAYPATVFRTGDMARLEADGNFTFLGRRDHMVKTRGNRVELGEIEHALYRHESVREAGLVAVADDEQGALLYAAVSLHEGAEAEEEDLLDHVAEVLPRFMVPERIFVETELPKTSNGKISRVDIKAEIVMPRIEG